jgi:DNA-binding NarL/FixJ family response regulator
MKSNLLLVEDLKSDLDILLGFLDSIPLPFRDVARDADSAEAFIESACQEKFTYDLVLMDLELPQHKGGNTDVQKGFELLRRIREKDVAHEVIVYTSHANYDNLMRTLRGGAGDFIAKDSLDREKKTRLQGALRRVLEKKSDRLLEERIRKLIPYAERAVAQRFTPCFSHLVQDVVYAVEGIESYAAERYNLDPERDSQDSLMQSLSKHKEAVKTAQRQWRCLQSKLSGGDSELAEVTVETLLEEIQQDLEPCLMIKETKLTLVPNNNTKVQSFQNDVRAVLREVITGALSELSNHGNPHFINVAVNTDNGQERAEVRFQDDLDTISAPNANTINDGSNVIDDKSFGRLWGLQVAQQMAMRSGGRLHVQPESERGNVVSCFIPLA